MIKPFFSKYLAILKQVTPLTVKRLTVTFLLIGLAASLRIWPLQTLGVKLVWLTFYPAVMIIAIYGGFFSGIIATALACLIAYYGGPLLVKAAFIQGQADWVGMLVFVLTGSMISSVAEAMRLAQLHARQAQERAETANRAKSEFLAVMSHEIRTPLHGVLGLAHLLGQTELSDKQRVYLSNLQISGESLLSTINDILDFSKIESGMLNLESIPYNLDDVLRKLSSVVSFRAWEKGLNLVIKTMPNVPRLVVGDPSRLGQVLLNLVGNAIKFTDKGEILVKTSLLEQSPEHVTLLFSVMDTGIGMTGEQITHLFEPFTQADSSTNRKYGGTGLGLSISQRLVKLMSGKIEIDSQFGQGSRFSFTISLPLQAAESVDPALNYPELSGTHILVVEDDPATLQTLHSALDTFAHLTVVSSAQAGWELLQNQGIHAPFTYVFMDGAGSTTPAGLELRRSLQQGPVSIILMLSDRVNAPRVENPQTESYLLKPFDPAQLFECIMNLQGQKYINPPGQATLSIQSSTLEKLANHRVLVVEDNEINQIIARETLQQMGLQVTVASSGEEALQKLKENHFDAVLMDLQMPGMDGYQATAQIRKDWNPAEKRLPIIAMTAHAMEGNRQQALDADMDDYISKPVNFPKFANILSRWIEPQPGKPEAAPAVAFPASVTPPLLSGVIDVDSALGRLGGNKVLYQRLLSMFAADHDHTVQEIRTALQGSDPELTRRLTHSFKGLAGTIGANDLSSSIKQLEQAISLLNKTLQEEKLLLVEKNLASVLEAIDQATQPAAADD